MILPSLVIAPTAHMGRGVFTTEDLSEGTVIELSPVIVMQAEDRPHLDKTLLYDYIFEWGPDSRQCCMALGYIPIYNHAYNSNCEYEMDYEDQTILVRTVCPVLAGEELFINYNGNFDDERPVWFDKKP